MSITKGPVGFMEGTCLDLDLSLPACFVAVRTVAPALDEVARSGSSGELKIRCGCSFCGGQFGSGLERRGSPSKRVRFPLCGTEYSTSNKNVCSAEGRSRGSAYLRVLFWLVLAWYAQRAG